MKKAFVSHVFTLILTLILFVTILPACNISSPYYAKLSFSEPPLLNKPVEITFTFSIRPEYKRNSSNITAKITLPPHIKLISGDPVWHGNMYIDQTYTIKATVKVTKIGYFAIFGRVLGGASVGGGNTIYIGVFQDKAITYHNLPKDIGDMTYEDPYSTIQPE
jgi:hypothetical protein